MQGQTSKQLDWDISFQVKWIAPQICCIPFDFNPQSMQIQVGIRVSYPQNGILAEQGAARMAYCLMTEILATACCVRISSK